MYCKRSRTLTLMIAVADDWRILSTAWTGAIPLPESLAAHEKNYKTRCRHNPMVPMVREKTNAVIGI